jgi:hypothetical protein
MADGKKEANKEALRQKVQSTKERWNDELDEKSNSLQESSNVLLMSDSGVKRRDTLTSFGPSRELNTLHTTVKTGMLHKRGHQWKTWKHRFFVLTHSRLLYYTEEGGTQKGEVDFSARSEIVVKEATVPGSPTAWSFVLELGSYSLEMAAVNEQVMQGWIQDLQRVTTDWTEMNVDAAD